MHFEIVGKDAERTQSYYSELFGCEIERLPLAPSALSRRSSRTTRGITLVPHAQRSRPDLCQAAAGDFAGRVAPTSFSFWRSGEIRTTLCARPTFSIAQITIAEMSTSKRPSP